MDLQRFNKKEIMHCFLNELNEIKVEFDLIFVSLVDKISCAIVCSLSSSSVSIPHIENSLYNSPTGDTWYELSIFLSNLYNCRRFYQNFIRDVRGYAGY
jgi:hypothetical protein